MTAKINSPAKRGFTIIELAIIVAVLGILTAILVPTFSNMGKEAEQRALRMDIQNAYVSFRTDCGFRDEPYLEMNEYIFLPQKAVEFTTPGSGDTTNIRIVAKGYKWDGNDKNMVTSLAASKITPNLQTGLFGPYNNYYLLAYNQANTWNGDGSEASPYLIRSYRDLRSIAENVARGNTFSGKHFSLTTSITVSNESWLPIGGYLAPTQADTSGKAVFKGTFNGNGYTISLYYGRVAQDGYCLFGATDGATIKNLKVAGAVDVNANAGGIVAIANNTIIQNCVNEATVAGNHHVGGIVGCATGNTKVLGCLNAGDVTAYSMTSAGHNNIVGGIVGEAQSLTSVQDCRNDGDVMGMGGMAGGIAGLGMGTLKNCVNNGAVSSQSNALVSLSATDALDSLAGGILGYGNATGTVDGCTNTGSVTALYRVAGGIAGANAKILNCANTGNVTASGYAGGIVGLVNSSDCTVANVVNTGTVASTKADGSLGGIIGRLDLSEGYSLKMAVSGGQVHYRKGTSGAASGQAGMFVGTTRSTVTLTNTYRSLEKGVYVGSSAAAATAVGAGNSSGSPTTQTNQSNLRSTLTNLVNNSYSGKGYCVWTVESGYLNSICMPTPTYYVTYDTSNMLPPDRQVGLGLNSTFIGAGQMYLPFLQHTVVVNGDWQYTFQGWSVNGSTMAPGAQVVLTGDLTITAIWNKDTYTMTPIPFN